MNPRLEAYLIRYRERLGRAGCRVDDVVDEAIVRALRGVLFDRARLPSMGHRQQPNHFPRLVGEGQRARMGHHWRPCPEVFHAECRQCMRPAPCRHVDTGGGNVWPLCRGCIEGMAIWRSYFSDIPVIPRLLASAVR